MRPGWLKYLVDSDGAPRAKCIEIHPNHLESQGTPCAKCGGLVSLSSDLVILSPDLVILSPDLVILSPEKSYLYVKKAKA